METLGKMISVFFLLGLCALTFGSPLSVHRQANRTSSFVGIKGGTEVKIADYPYQASILFNQIHACCGSILSKKYILTAAHCFNTERRVEVMQVRVGSSDLNKGGQVVPVKKLNIMRSYMKQTKEDDVAVLELSSELTYGTGIGPVALPSSTTTFKDGELARVTGWGASTTNGPINDKLQMAQVPLFNTATCQSRKYSYGNDVKPSMFCAGAGSTDACQGDSGGPLIYNGLQIGIVSFGKECGDPNYPGIYTKVTKVLSFIQGFL